MTIDIFAITKRFSNRRTRDQTAQITSMHVAGSVIIRIEEERVFRNRRPVILLPGFEHECFKKPGGMGQVPLRGTDIRHGLDDAIFCLEIAREQSGKVAHIMKACQERVCARLRQLHRFRRCRLRHVNFLLTPAPRDAPRAFDREPLLRDLR